MLRPTNLRRHFGHVQSGLTFSENPLGWSSLTEPNLVRAALVIYR